MKPVFSASSRVAPLSLIRLALAAAPSPAVDRAAGLVFARTLRRHPRLAAAFAAQSPATVVVAPTDCPHVFALTFGTGPARLQVLENARARALRQGEARIEGTLESLLNLLEGREDGDALFFSRRLRVTGDTQAIVALRNILDRESLIIMEEVLSLFGPFAEPLGLALSFADALGGRLYERLRGAGYGVFERGD